ncbi:MAG: ATP-dependent 6-phosphofructokinase [Proteobacteria bacterium]|nr:ATP-dependent 6-phosphofructokinase [Pseudomonadota bacterium]
MSRNKKQVEIPSTIQTLGPAKIQSPLLDSGNYRGHPQFFQEDDVRIPSDILWSGGQPPKEPGPTFELAGPRSKIYFDSSKLKCAVVTCGGLCPGINSVVRSIVLELHHIYGVRNVVGVKFGFQGFIPRYGHDLMELLPETVADAHGRGGSFLGMSRGAQDIGEIVDALERLNIGLLFTIGGDGTLHAADLITEEIQRRGLKTGVIGIPKTIDNDIAYVDQTFGFSTAVEAAARVILSAHNESTSAPYGLGLVKVMGRHSGFVAVNAVLALKDVNICLIPEVNFDLEGDHGLLAAIRERVVDRGHGVVLVAEGAGQQYCAGDPAEHDASGNVKLGDIGIVLRERITEYFKKNGLELNLKYIDPSYEIRSQPANATDRIYCGFLGQQAVHAGMAGKTGMVVSMLNNHYVHVPIKMAISHRKQVNSLGALWRSVLESTGQPPLAAA